MTWTYSRLSACKLLKWLLTQKGGSRNEKCPNSKCHLISELCAAGFLNDCISPSSLSLVRMAVLLHSTSDTLIQMQWMVEKLLGRWTKQWWNRTWWWNKLTDHNIVPIPDHYCCTPHTSNWRHIQQDHTQAYTDHTVDLPCCMLHR